MYKQLNLEKLALIDLTEIEKKEIEDGNPWVAEINTTISNI